MEKQNDRLLSYMKEGREVDSRRARRELGIDRLAARICDLRNAGHPITTERKTVENRFGEECKVALYRLEAA